MLMYAQEWANSNAKKMKRVKVFPYCFVEELDLTHLGFGKWTMLCIIESKSNLKKNVATFRMFQTYHVTHAKDKDNNGVGIYEVVPNDDGFVRCDEYTPHAVQRTKL